MPTSTSPKTSSNASAPPCSKGGQAPPSGTPPLSGTFGEPSAHPFGSEGGVRRTREDGLTRRAEPCLTAAQDTLQPQASPAAGKPGGGQPPLLLGIDPGLAATGWGLLDGTAQAVACGTIRTAPGPAAPRLLELVSELRAVLAGHAVGEIALEELFMGRNATSAIGVAQARGAILVAVAAAGLPVFEYKPAQVKATLTGYGMAGKAQMARMLALQVRAPGRLDEHAADALAIALCHARSRRLRALTSG